MTISSKTKKAVAAGTLLLAGAGAGAAVAVTGSASAADDTGTTSSSASSTPGDTAGPGEQADPSKSIRSDEELLSGTTADKVTAAAMEEYPGATIQRVETDSDGVYEAHLVTTDGDQVIVQVGEDFAVTGTQTGGGSGGHGDHDGDGPDAPAPSSTNG